MEHSLLKPHPSAAIRVCNLVLPLNKARQNVFTPKMMETWNKISSITEQSSEWGKTDALMELSYMVTKSKVLSIRIWCDKYHICHETMRVFCPCDSEAETRRVKHRFNCRVTGFELITNVKTQFCSLNGNTGLFNATVTLCLQSFMSKIIMKEVGLLELCLFVLCARECGLNVSCVLQLWLQRGR